MRRVFADTFFFLAYFNRSDSAHSRAASFFQDFKGQVVSSEWVLIEFAGALASVNNRRIFEEFYEFLQNEPNVKIISATTDGFRAGVRLYSERTDKDWSLTDCVSFLIMADENLSEALTGDHHFTQAGFVALLK